MVLKKSCSDFRRWVSPDVFQPNLIGASELPRFPQSARAGRFAALRDIRAMLRNKKSDEEVDNFRC
jgi:hypothetical protein